MLLFAPVLFGLSPRELAKSLEGEKDWYRAIGEWKQVRFEAQSLSPAYWEASQAIVLDLWKAGQYEVGLDELQNLSTSGDRPSQVQAQNLWAWTGIFQYRLSRYPAAEYSLTQAQNPLYLGLLQAATGRLEAARISWQGLALPDPSTLSFDSRDPVVAALLSTALPGSGQVYSKHYFDGAQAAAFVGAFGFAAYACYRYDSKFSDNYLLTGVAGLLAATFYASNIYGAFKTAEYFNQNQSNARTTQLEAAVFQQPLPDLSE
jgi:hypothetical protein